MTKVERFVEKIKKELGIELDPTTFVRSYAGYHQRGKGAFVWWMNVKNSPTDYGSGESITSLLKAKNGYTIINREICSN